MRRVAPSVMAREQLQGLLVGWGIAADGAKHLLHLAVGNKESEACWTEFFRSMLGRGLRLPTTITSDGAPGAGQGHPGVLPGKYSDPVLVPPAREHPGEAARRGSLGGDGARLCGPRRPHPRRREGGRGPAGQHLRPAVPGGGGLLDHVGC